MFETQIFEITTADFKDTGYGLRDVYLVTLHRIKFPDGYVPQNHWGVAKVKFVGRDGKELAGLDYNLQLIPYAPVPRPLRRVTNCLVSAM